MKYRIDKKSGNELSILGFGCMRFPGALGTDLQKTEELVMHAIEKGVNYFDTAWIYPGSEEALGTILAKNNVRFKAFISTKLPLILYKNKSEKVDFDKYFNQSLERLKTDYIDYYLMHMITDMDHWNKVKSWGIENWIAQKKKSGQIKKVGFSYHGNATEFIKILNDYDWELVTLQYNYSDENYQAGVQGIRAAAEKMPVIVMEPLLGGKLATSLPKEAVKIFNQADENLSPVGWALNWIWNQKEVTALISGMSTMKQLDENIKLAENASAGMLNDSHKVVYNNVLNSINQKFKVKCTGCNYCMPCPFGVNIPGCFSAYNASYSMGYVEGLKQFAVSTGMTAVKSGSPSLCTKCGKCEPLCPQQIPIIKELIPVKKRMEPFFVRLIGACARGFLGRKRKKVRKN